MKCYSNSNDEPVLVGYKGSRNGLPVPDVKLREENGELRAFNHRGERVFIPECPEEGANIGDWLSEQSLEGLEAARLYYSEMWLWEDNNIGYRALVEYIEGWQARNGTVADAAYFFCPYIPLMSEPS